MENTWFCLVALMIAVYAVLDGFDLGAGIVHAFVARTDAERRDVLRSIGPVWDGNEVWLLAGGGTLYFAFPVLYAASFSGFYLPLMIVLWLLILRGVAIEFRNHVRSAVWQPFWDTVFAGASGLLAIFFGAALGNVVRGVPLSPSSDFFLPLWTDFQVGKNAGILDWYTILLGVCTFLTLAVHGALWVALKTGDELELRARRFAGQVWWGLMVSVLFVTLASFHVQPHLRRSFRDHPWGYVVPLLALVGLIGIERMNRRARELEAFLASCLFIAGMLASAAFGIYPNVLPSSSDPSRSLTIYNSAAGHYGLKVGLRWFIPGMLLTAGYFFYTYSRFPGKIEPQDSHS